METGLTRLFFYGTLLHHELLEIVLARSVSQGELRPARLANHRVVWAKDQIFPLILTAPGHRAAGVIFEASPADVARLDFYEGGFNYDLQRLVCEGETHTSHVYFPRPGTWETGAAWSLADFVHRHGDHTLRTARAFMQLFGVVSRQEAMARLPMLRAVLGKTAPLAFPTGVGPSEAGPSEAGLDPNSALLAPAREASGGPLGGVSDGAKPDLGHFGTAQVQLLAHQRVWQGFFGLDTLQFSHRRFDGGTSGPLSREVFSSVDAVLVLPWDPRRDRVMLVEQFRAGAFMRTDPKPWLLEPVAGLIDAGETAEAAGRREALEECGLTMTSLIPISGHYPSPGASNEFFHCFLGVCDIPDDAAGLAGLACEGEDIRSHILSFSALMALVDRFEARVGPLVLMALWLARHRATLGGFGREAERDI